MQILKEGLCVSKSMCGRQGELTIYLAVLGIPAVACAGSVMCVCGELSSVPGHLSRMEGTALVHGLRGVLPACVREALRR